MVTIYSISSKINVKPMAWMREENWPTWLYLTDANSRLMPVSLDNMPVADGSESAAHPFENMLFSRVKNAQLMSFWTPGIWQGGLFFIIFLKLKNMVKIKWNIKNGFISRE